MERLGQDLPESIGRRPMSPNEEWISQSRNLTLKPTGLRFALAGGFVPHEISYNA